MGFTAMGPAAAMALEDVGVPFTVPLEEHMAAFANQGMACGGGKQAAAGGANHAGHAAAAAAAAENFHGLCGNAECEGGFELGVCEHIGEHGHKLETHGTAQEGMAIESKHTHETFVDDKTGQAVTKCVRTQLYRVKNAQAVRKYRERKKTELQELAADNARLQEENARLTSENEALTAKCMDLEARFAELRVVDPASLELTATRAALDGVFESLVKLRGSYPRPS